MKYAALVIALNSYDNNPSLVNAESDGKAMADKFRELKYDVIELFGPDATYAGYTRAVSELMGKDFENHYDAIILYFAGHGFMTNASDYLAMKDCDKLEAHQGLAAAMLSVRLQDFIEKFRLRAVTRVIAILDACRDDLSDYAAVRGAGRMADILSSKFGSMTVAPFDTFIAYSTTATKSSSDGGKEVGHSRYTSALLEVIDKPLPIEQVFKEVRKKVHQKDDDQLPWEHTCLNGEFYFNYGQLDPYYGKIYPKDCYEDEHYVTFNPSVQRVLELLVTKDVSKHSKGIAHLSILKASANSEDLFEVGRIIMRQAIADSLDCRRLVEGRRLESFNRNGANDLVNGILYEIYFDSHGNYNQKNITNLALLNSLSQFSNSSYCASSVKFISDELENVLRKPFYKIGKKQFYNAYVELTETDYQGKDGSTIYYIESIEYEDNDYLDEIEFEPYILQPQEIRNELSRYFQIPLILLRTKMNGNARHILRHDFPERLEEILFEILVSGSLDDIDQLAPSGYSPNDISVMYIDDAQIEEDYMMLEGSCYASFDLYFDDDTMSMSFPGRFEMELDYKGGKWHNKSHSPFSFDTRKYYE